MTTPRYFYLTVALIILGLPHAARAQTNPAPANPAGGPASHALPPGVELVVIGKGGGRDLHAVIATPKHAATPMPAVLWIHGGGWSGGSYQDGLGYMHQLVQHGYFAASIEYRLSGEAKWPAQIEDCKCAVRWLRANAAKYNVDPNRIGVWGGSAGGHLVSCLGTMGDVKQYEGDGGWPGVSSEVKVVVNYFGPTDFIKHADFDPDKVPRSITTVEHLFGAKMDENPDLYKSGSPIAYVKAGQPPELLIHGDADDVVPISQSISFDAALTAAGVPHQFVIVKGGGHGFGHKPGVTLNPGTSEIEKITFEFLDKYLQPKQPTL